MLSLSNPHDLIGFLTEKRKSGSRIGFVPTMGALHKGHISLVERAKKECDFVVVSVFVNPTQFGPNEDFNKYPRSIEADSQMLVAAGSDMLFLPNVSDIYPDAQPEISITIAGMDKILEGKTRPGHFNGVLLVLARLFNILGPCKTYLGLKDFQQVAVVKKMVQELFFPVEIVPCPTLREADGLAMSSRNRYLNEEERQQALFLFNALRLAKREYAEGKPTSEIQNEVKVLAENYPLIKLDYIEIVESSTLLPVEILTNSKNPVALIAAWCGTTRLIDNIPLIP